MVGEAILLVQRKELFREEGTGSLLLLERWRGATEEGILPGQGQSTAFLLAFLLPMGDHG